MPLVKGVQVSQIKRKIQQLKISHPNVCININIRDSKFSRFGKEFFKLDQKNEKKNPYLRRE